MLWYVREVMGNPDSEFVELMSPEDRMVGNIFKDSVDQVLRALNGDTSNVGHEDAERWDGQS